jgi:hypothetical protein
VLGTLNGIEESPRELTAFELTSVAAFEDSDAVSVGGPAA